MSITFGGDTITYSDGSTQSSPLPVGCMIATSSHQVRPTSYEALIPACGGYTQHVTNSPNPNISYGTTNTTVLPIHFGMHHNIDTEISGYKFYRGSNGAGIQFALYDCDAYGFPANQVSGTVATDAAGGSVGVISLSLSSNVSIPTGWYWVAMKSVTSAQAPNVKSSGKGAHGTTLYPERPSFRTLPASDQSGQINTYDGWGYMITDAAGSNLPSSFSCTSSNTGRIVNSQYTGLPGEVCYVPYIYVRLANTAPLT